MECPRREVLAVLIAALAWAVLPQGARASGENNKPSDSTLRVMTLNIAHGRGESGHQAMEKRPEIEANLKKIAEVVRREKPDLAALQEADGRSFWSGNFNHVEFLAREAECAHHFRGEHMGELKLSYGTAILSRLPLVEPFSVTFSPSPPTLSKGFVAAQIAWPGRPGTKIDVASVHLDFARQAVRSRQVKELVAKLSGRDRPLVVMGDFNCQWSDHESAVRAVAEGLHLRAYQPDSRNLATFPSFKLRIDWLLVSEPLEFVEYRVLPDRISDHRGVIAVLRLPSK